MSFSKKNLIIIGLSILILILTIIFVSSKSKKTKTIDTVVTENDKDFDTKKETPTPTLTPTPTKKPTLTPTLKPTNTPIPTDTPIPTSTPTNKPTPKKKATPTKDTNIYATGIVLSVTELNLKVDQSYKVSYRVEPNETTNKTIYWSSSNGDIALVTSDGWIVGKKVGETTITAKTINGKTNTIKVKVGISTPTVAITATPTAVPYPTRIDLSLARLILKVGEVKNLYVKYQPENIINKTVTWTTSDSSVLSVTSSGVVTGIKLGTATIKVVSANNLSGTATVVVSN